MQVDPDKAFAVQIAHDENVVTSNVSYIQCAVLYTSSSGERRIRSGTSQQSLLLDLSHPNKLSFPLDEITEPCIIQLSSVMSTSACICSPSHLSSRVLQELMMCTRAPIDCTVYPGTMTADEFLLSNVAHLPMTSLMANGRYLQQVQVPHNIKSSR